MPEKLSEDGREEKIAKLREMEAEFHRKLRELTASAKEHLRGPNGTAVMDELVSFLTQPIPELPKDPGASSTPSQTQQE